LGWFLCTTSIPAFLDERDVDADRSTRIPNLPFFYLAYRAWSHWRAALGGKHVQWLIKNRLIQEAPSTILDNLYKPTAHLAADDSPDAPERLLLTGEQAQSFADKLEMPALASELERAIWQVEQAQKTDVETKKE
jgi:Mitochondrial K+-H+ exchange-related